MAWGNRWRSAPHLEVLNHRLMQVAWREVRRLLVTMPPRHGKSLLGSEIFPAWYLGWNPDHRYMLASYEANFAASWGRKARALLQRFGPSHFEVAVSRESSAASEWGIAGHRGGMSTAGVGGAFTGKGADILGIDDPIKNAEEANSFIIRQKIWEWYLSTAYTRLEPEGAVIVIQTRWHDDDLAGRILKAAGENGEQWEVLDFPALAEDDDPLGRDPGAALWPERYSRETLLGIRDVEGDYFFESLYQGRPPSKQGKIFAPEWFRDFIVNGGYYRLFDGNGQPLCAIDPNHCERFAIVDCAATSEDEAKERKGKPPSDSVVSTFDYHYPTGYLIWIDCVLGKWAFPELLGNVRTTFELHNPAWIGVENEKTGKAVIQMLAQMPMRPVEHEGKDKLVRSGRAQNEMRMGKIFLPRNAGWRRQAQKQLTEWTGMQDERIDIGDTLFYACLHKGLGAGGTLVLDSTIMGR